VWLSYGLSFIAIVALIIQSLMGKSAVLKSVKREQQRESRLQQVQQKGETL
jgi:heme exporter protein ccmD